MRIDLREVIVNPSVRLPFRVELETENLDFPSVLGYRRPPVAEGLVYNEAGVLRLQGKLTAELICSCDRCGKEFDSVKETPLDAVLAQEENEENPELFVLSGTELDLQELLETCLVLDMESKFLCREDCKGLCPRCGRDLNKGPCDCGKELDPRLAVLEQLLKKNES